MQNGRKGEGRGASDHAIEAQDIPPSQDEEGEGFFRQILQRMSPAECLAPTGTCATSCTNPLFDEQDVEEIVSQLLPDLKNEGKLRSVALLKLYRLTDKERAENRIHVICTTKFNIIRSLVPCLSLKTSSSDRRQALLLISNLCIPEENKAAILLGEPHMILLPALLQIISNRLNDAYLAVVCLYNLSFLKAGQSLLFHYVPPLPASEEPPSEYRHTSAPLDNPLSLFRTLESAVQDFLPFVAVAEEQPKLVSVEGEMVRFCMGFFRNVVSVNAHAVMTQSILPDAAVQSLQTFVKLDLSVWKQDSLPDSCLVFLMRLAQDSKCIPVLQQSQEMHSVLRALEGRGGIHEKRAMELLARIQTVPKQKPSKLQRKQSSPRREEKKEWV